MLTYFSFHATFFSLAAGFVFFLAAQKCVAPEHRAGMLLSALQVKLRKLWTVKLAASK